MCSPYPIVIDFLKKVKNRLIQQVSQIEFIDSYFEEKRNTQIIEHRNKLPDLSIGDRKIVDQLQRQGIYISHLNELNIDNTKQLWNLSSKVTSSLIDSNINHKNQFFIQATKNQIQQYPDLFLWGLNSRLLDLIENYLSLPVAYHGIYIRRDLANGIEKKSRLWHLDKEDRKMLKIIIYLNDINDENGAFQYIPKHFTSQIIQKQKYKYNYIKEKIMDSTLSPSSWISCPGKKGTVIFVDTANLFHRGLLPKKSERLSIFFDYTSAMPWRPYYCKNIFSPQEIYFLSSLLSERQKNIFLWNNKLKKEYGSNQGHEIKKH